MTLYSWGDVAAGALDQAPTPVKESVAAARKFACGLYKAYEGYYGNTAPQGPLEGLKRGVWDKICDNGLPPVPSDPPPWDGNSCACVEYLVEGLQYETSGIGQRLPWNAIVTGPIFGIRVAGGFPGGATFFLRHGRCTNGVFSGVRERELGGASGPERTYQITSINRVAGQGDSCPVPSPNPIPPPTPPSPSDQKGNTNITIAPGVTINAPITLVGPTTNVSLNPSVEVNVGPLNVNFGLGGINVDISPSFNPTLIVPVVNLPSLPGPRPLPLPPSGGVCPDPCPDIDYARIEAAIRAERKFYAKPKTRREVAVLGSGVGGTVVLPAEAAWVRLVLTKEPLSVQEQFGAGGPDVLFAGWHSFGVGTGGERIPISYRQNTYLVPKGATQFSWTVYRGAIASVSALLDVPTNECETSLCQ